MKLTRRDMMSAFAASGLAVAPAFGAGAPAMRVVKRPIPATGEPLGVVGIGTSRVFDVHRDATAVAQCREVVRIFFDAGASLIDTGAAYYSAETVAGDAARAAGRDRAFLATKILTEDEEQARIQIERSRDKLGPDPIDLMQIHNLEGWRTHLPFLLELKAAGKIRYVGVTHHIDAALPELIEIVRTQQIDFVAFQYSLAAREAEKQLLPLAADRGVAFIANKPFAQGALFRSVQGRALPEEAIALGCSSWAQLFLRFIISHPAVNCVIPGTGKPQHARDNVTAGFAPALSRKDGELLNLLWQGD